MHIGDRGWPSPPPIDPEVAREDADRRDFEKLLQDYFSDGIGSYQSGRLIGMEVETQFCSVAGTPIDLSTSQRIFAGLVEHGWAVTERKGDLITELRNGSDKFLYELSRANLELSVGPRPRQSLLAWVRMRLDKIYKVARACGAEPMFEPLLLVDRPEDLLVLPDRRDEEFAQADGLPALGLLTQCSAVQFTIDVTPDQAVGWLNALGGRIDTFLEEYPQHRLWREYIKRSAIRYEGSRYGGPLCFGSFADYCRQLATYRIIAGGSQPQLVRYDPRAYCRPGEELNVARFLRSVWWHFRLRRYGARLCLEIRPLARRSDNDFTWQLEAVLDILPSSRDAWRWGGTAGGH